MFTFFHSLHCPSEVVDSQRYRVTQREVDGGRARARCWAAAAESTRARSQPARAQHNLSILPLPPTLLSNSAVNFKIERCKFIVKSFNLYLVVCLGYEFKKIVGLIKVQCKCRCLNVVIKTVIYLYRFIARFYWCLIYILNDNVYGFVRIMRVYSLFYFVWLFKTITVQLERFILRIYLYFNKSYYCNLLFYWLVNGSVENTGPKEYIFNS